MSISKCFYYVDEVYGPLDITTYRVNDGDRVNLVRLSRSPVRPQFAKLPRAPVPEPGIKRPHFPQSLVFLFFFFPASLEVVIRLFSLGFHYENLVKTTRAHKFCSTPTHFFFSSIARLVWALGEDVYNVDTLPLYCSTRLLSSLCCAVTHVARGTSRCRNQALRTPSVSPIWINCWTCLGMKQNIDCLHPMYLYCYTHVMLLILSLI